MKVTATTERYETRIRKIQLLAAEYRKYIMRMTLDEMVQGTGSTLSRISAFEHGRSNNLANLFLYLDKCTPEIRAELLGKVNKIMIGEDD